MIYKVSVCIYLVVATFIYLANGLTKFSSSGYHIVHNDLPANHMFRFLQGNAPRYRSPPPPPILPQGIQGIAMFGQSSPAPGNPFAQFNPAYGAHFPTGGVAVCAMPPPQCQKSAYRTMDGSCNHLDNPQAGVANTRINKEVTDRQEVKFLPQAGVENK